MKKYCGSIIVLVLFFGCNSQPTNVQVKNTEHTLFSAFAMAETGKQFPPSKEILENCRQVKDTSCLTTYASFNAGKEKLLQMPRQDALELTLKWLNESCMSDPPENYNFVCVGTLMALSLFPDEAEDKSIRQSLTNLPKSTRDNVIDWSTSLSLCWLENRTDKTAWRKWVDTNIMDTRIKSHAISRLENRDSKPDPLSSFPYEMIARVPSR